MLQGPEPAKAGETVLSPQFTDSIRSIVLSRDDRLLAVAGWGGIIQVWDLPSKRLVVSMNQHTDFIHKSAFLSTDEQLLSVTVNRTVNLLELKSLEVLRSFPIPEGISRGAVVSPDDKRLVTLGPGP